MYRLRRYALDFVQIPAELTNYKSEENYKSADLILRYDKELSTPTNTGIYNASNEHRPILRRNGGKYSVDDLDAYLGIFNSINDLHNKLLLDDESVANEYSDYVVKAASNSEIQNYLMEIRKKDDTYFRGFDELRTFFENS